MEKRLKRKFQLKPQKKKLDRLQKILLKKKPTQVHWGKNQEPKLQ